jgi:hypothetical protein
MGWSYAVARDGREIGYSVEATCDHPECDAMIDRGLGYLCGEMHEDEQFGCGKYFCQDHLGVYEHEDGTLCSVCDECRTYFDEHREDEEE